MCWTLLTSSPRAHTRKDGKEVDGRVNGASARGRGGSPSPDDYGRRGCHEVLHRRTPHPHVVRRGAPGRHDNAGRPFPSCAGTVDGYRNTRFHPRRGRGGLMQEGTTEQPGHAGQPIPPVDVALDVALGVAGVASHTLAAAGVVAGRLRARARPLVEVALRPPMVTDRLQPATLISEAARRGAVSRGRLVSKAVEAIDAAIPSIVAAVLRTLDLNLIVTENVDLDRIVEEVDLDAAVSRVDIDAIAMRLDVDAVIDRLDLTEIVKRRVDIDELVATVDLDAAAARLDVDAVIDRVDLVGLVQEVIAAIDLPEIIRESTGSVASETLRGVRMQSITGDDAIARVVERMRLHRARGGATPRTV